MPVPTPLTFDHIPTGRELLPTGGLPGVLYIQVATENAWKVQQDEDLIREYGEISPIADKPIYRVIGPKGQIACQLWGAGRPLPGGTSHAIRPRFKCDELIPERTGCPVSVAGRIGVADPEPGVPADLRAEGLGSLVPESRTAKSATK